MRKIAFGYSTRCNVRCEHCVAADDIAGQQTTMELDRALELIAELHTANVKGISFTAGEPLLYLDDIVKLLERCRAYGIYTRVVSNSFWAKSPVLADATVGKLKESGLCQLRLSYSRWHQKNIAQQNVLNAAQSCLKNGLDYFISFVTDFSAEDTVYEDYLRQHGLRFFPEAVIYSGRAQSFARLPIQTDYQENRCAMNPYLAPTLDLYACCDAGGHFTRTNFFHLGNLRENSVAELFRKSESNSLYAHIRNMGISAIASFAGYPSAEIVQYRKCELCEKLFNTPDSMARLQKEADSEMKHWYR